MDFVSNKCSTEQWVSVEQIAQHLNVKTFTVYKWLERKSIPAHKVGRLWRFRISDVDQWIKFGGQRVEQRSK
ncbi:MAG: helix-turn-helix domain-containing protein [Deltaproteobacteria bacterium]|nr:helix-turn-helix domain-containing protein [Deltaproteobacteria bacterium]